LLDLMQVHLSFSLILSLILSHSLSFSHSLSLSLLSFQISLLVVFFVFI
jgi:hypothetical protein